MPEVENGHLIGTSSRRYTSTPLTRQEQQEEVARRTALGESALSIAKYLGISDRQVRNIRHKIREGSTNIVMLPPPRQPHELPARAKRMIKRTVEGFGEFYEEYSGLYFPNHARLWVEAYLANNRLLLNVPPRHAKSKFFSVWIPIWEIAQNRDVQILLVTSAKDLARKWSNEISWHLEHNKKLIADFGMFVPQDGSPWRRLQGELMVAGRQREVLMGDLTVQIRGALQHILGMESDRIIVDDIVDPKKMNSPTYVQELSDFFHGEIMTRQSPNSKVTVIGQRVHHEDLYGELAAKRLSRVEGNPPLWNHVNFPAILDWKEEKVLWPEEWSFERLMERYEDMKQVDGSLFEIMYQQNPLPPDSTLVRPEWIDGDNDHPGCLDTDRIAGMATEPPEGWRKVRILAVDPGPTKFTGMVLADVFYPPADQRIPFGQTPFYCAIIKVVRGRYNLREMVGEVKEIVTSYYPDHLIFEINAAQRWFFQDLEFMALRNELNLSVIPHTTGAKKTDPDFGIQSLASDFEQGRIRLCAGDSAGRGQSNLLLEEAYAYPSPLKTNDILMALWFIKFNHRGLSAKAEAPKLRQEWRDWNVPKYVAGGWDFLRGM